MPFEGIIGLPYTRDTVTEALGLPPTHQGNWGNGYPKHEGEYFVFATLGQAGRVGPGYEGGWVDGALEWTTQNDGHLGQTSVAELVSGRHTVHVFYRYSNRSTFIYAGRGTATNVHGERPVELTWSFPRPFTNARLRWALADNGFDLATPTTKVQGARRGGLTIYIKQAETYPLVLPPYYSELREPLMKIRGVALAPLGEFYHSSNMLEFPQRVHTGQGVTHFGLAVGLEDDADIDALVATLVELDPILNEERRGEARRRGRRRRPIADNPATETEALRAHRLGQSGFRADLFDRYNSQCALTGITMPELLRASHIKPWSRSSNEERLDPNNGILLSIHLDVLFDKGLLTFNQDGAVELSPRLDPTISEFYNLRKLKTLQLTPEVERYMVYHRADVFKR